MEEIELKQNNLKMLSGKGRRFFTVVKIVFEK